MKTFVAEPMPNLFWQEVVKNKWQDYFYKDFLSEAEVLIVRTKTKVTKDYLSKLPNLKTIIRAGTGFDNIDIQEAVSRSLAVCNTPEANALSAAEHTISLIFAMLKQHQIGKRRVLDKTWKLNLNSNWEIADLKVLLVGLGRVGSRVASVLQNLGAQVKGVDPYLSGEEWQGKGISPIPYIDGLHWCNLLSFHCPLYNSTEDYFNVEILKEFSSSAWLVNTARGAIVNEQAVEQGLLNGKLLGYGADVFSVEPCKLVSYFSMANVYLTPHIGAFTQNAKNRLSMETLYVWQRLVFHNLITNPVDLKFC